jgi:hypothetical protein
MVADRLKAVTDEDEMMTMTRGAAIGKVRRAALQQAWRDGDIDGFLKNL